MVGGKMFVYASLANWVISALEGVVAIVLAACVLGEMVETEAVF
jgi:hypothetical protein